MSIPGRFRQLHVVRGLGDVQRESEYRGRNEPVARANPCDRGVLLRSGKARIIARRHSPEREPGVAGYWLCVCSRAAVWNPSLAGAVHCGLFGQCNGVGGVSSSLAISAGNTLEAVAFGIAVARWSDGVATFENPAGVARFALISLAAIDLRKSKIVELRFFGGLSIDETATVLAVSPGTVMRDWTLAKAWLRREVGSDRQQ